MDKISSLPDPILCHILSFLPVRVSATTSVLARRWRHVWTYVVDLLFIDQGYDENKMDFPDEVDRAMLLLNGSINRLEIRLSTYGYAMEKRVDGWINAAIARNVGVLFLSVIDSVQLPRCCFECKTLVELTLKDFEISCQPGDVCLPRLKKLHLLFNSFENDECLPNFVSGCGAIEELVVETSVCEDMNCCDVRSPTLKSLRLWFEFLWPVEVYELPHKLVLDIPAVQYLEIHSDFSQIILAEKLSSLVAAQICISRVIPFEAAVAVWRNHFQFVEKLSNAQSLTLKINASMKLLMNTTFSIATTKFHNLTKLEIEADWHLLTELLQSAYKLESLTILKVKDELKRWREPKNLPKCLLSSLKYVSIRGFAGGEDEVKMIRYILRHAEILERIEINSDEAYSQHKILEQISYSSRGSQICQLGFVSDAKPLGL